MRFVLALLMTIALALPTQAQTVEGADDLAFQNALSVWLDGQLSEGEPALIELAKAGHPAAQTLLARISATRVFFPRDHALSGQEPWLTAPMCGTASPQTDAERNANARCLFDLGEPMAAIDSMRTAPALTWESDFCSAAMAPGLPKPLRFYALMSELDGCPRDWPMDAVIAAFCEEARQGTPPFTPVLLLCDAAESVDTEDRFAAAMFADTEQQDMRDRLGDWALAEATSPIGAVCRTVCDEHARECAYWMLRRSKGLVGLAARWTPSERLIPQERFARSRLAAYQLWQSAKPGFGTENRSAILHWFGGGPAGRCLADAYHASRAPW